MDLTLATFQPLEGQPFKLVLDDGTELDVTLTRVSAMPWRAGLPAELTANREPFSLFFEGTQHAYCPQHTYTLKHDTLGAAQMFMVPVAELPGEIYRYQAVFS